MWCRWIFGGLPLAGLAAQQRVDDPADGVLLKPLLPRVHLAHALDNHLRRQLLEDHPAHAEAEGFEDLLLLQHRREQHHFGRQLVGLAVPDVRPGGTAERVMASGSARCRNQ